MFLREIIRFGTILVYVKELPRVVSKVARTGERSMDSNCFPAVFPQSASAEHRVVLSLLLRWCISRSVEAVTHRHAGKRPLLDTAKCLRHFQTANIQNSRNDIH